MANATNTVSASDVYKRQLELIQELYPNLEAVRAYAGARDVLRKTPEELKQLHELGLEMLFIGLESGSNKVLKEVNKGDSKQNMIDAAQMLHTAGIQQSVTIIAGLAGEDGWREHMLETADALNQMQPEFLGMLVLMPLGEAGLFGRLSGPSIFKEPSHLQVLQEMKLLLENLKLNDCFFSSAHASNYNVIKGHLPEEKERLLAQVSHLMEVIQQRQVFGV